MKRGIVLLSLFASLAHAGERYYCEAYCGGFVKTLTSSIWIRRRAKYIANPVWGEGYSKTRAFENMRKMCHREYSKVYILHHGLLPGSEYYLQRGKIVAGQLKAAFPSNSCYRD